MAVVLFRAPLLSAGILMTLLCRKRNREASGSKVLSRKNALLRELLAEPIKSVDFHKRVPFLPG